MYSGDEYYDDDCTSGIFDDEPCDPWGAAIDQSGGNYPITPAVDRIFTRAYQQLDQTPAGQAWAAHHLAELDVLDESPE